MLPTLEQLQHFDKPVPRYTSYPTAPLWGAVDASLYADHLEALGKSQGPLSLYVHIPFCKTMCLYCGCHVVLNRKKEVEEEYVHNLCQEIELISSLIGAKKRVVQLHFGGGTPTKLQEHLLHAAIEKIQSAFSLDLHAEVAIEIDPRTVYEDDAKKLAFLRSIGFNRVSFGVQDIDPKVQEAVRRRQSAAMTEMTFTKAKDLGFTGINMDLIYGLPLQTVSSFRYTVSEIIKMRPDRIALFSYAKVPWLKPHQKAIPEETLPTTEEKFLIYCMARQLLIESGYRAIGMDHFALPEDELAKAYINKTLQRNFQGYTVLPVEDLIGFGVSAIGSVQGAFFQNIKELQPYYEAIKQRRTPVYRGKVLHNDDHIRRWVIQRIMCDFRLDSKEFEDRFHIAFETYFQKEMIKLQPLIDQKLVTYFQDMLVVTELGELFVRLVASVFDYYYTVETSTNRFSKSI